MQCGTSIFYKLISLSEGKVIKDFHSASSPTCLDAQLLLAHPPILLLEQLEAACNNLPKKTDRKPVSERKPPRDQCFCLLSRNLETSWKTSGWLSQTWCLKFPGSWLSITLMPDKDQPNFLTSKSWAQGPASIVRYHSGQVSMRVSPVRWVAHHLASQVAQWKTREG